MWLESLKKFRYFFNNFIISSFFMNSIESLADQLNCLLIEDPKISGLKAILDKPDSKQTIFKGLTELQGISGYKGKNYSVTLEWYCGDYKLISETLGTIDQKEQTLLDAGKNLIKMIKDYNYGTRNIVKNTRSTVNYLT